MGGSKGSQEFSGLGEREMLPFFSINRGTSNGCLGGILRPVLTPWGKTMMSEGFVGRKELRSFRRSNVLFVFQGTKGIRVTLFKGGRNSEEGKLGRGDDLPTLPVG